MNDEQVTQEAPQLPQEPVVVNPVSPIQQPVATSQLYQHPVSEKPRLIKSLLILLVITFLLGLNIASLLIGDMLAGVLQGVPETGWGIVIAVYLFGPPFLIFGIITWLRVRSYRKSGVKIGQTVKVAALTAAVLFVLYVALTLY